MTEPLRAGLCDACAHRRVIATRTGSHFLLCLLSATDPAFPRYPRLPVLACAGYAPAPPAPGSDASAS